MVNQIAKIGGIFTLEHSYQPSSDTVGGVVEHMCNSVLAAHGLLWTDGAQEIVELLG